MNILRMAEEPEIDGGKVALDYYDCVVRYNDVDLLRGNHWLNDAIIGFYFEYLQHTHDSTSNNSTEVLFVSPELTQLLKLTDAADYSSFLEPLNAKQYSYVLFPLNNCESREAAGGSHWSLLAYSKKERTTFHLDSCGGMNRLAAGQFAKKIMRYLSESGAKDFEEMICPQQQNGYDCGLFVLCFTDAIVRQIRSDFGIRGCNFQDVLNNVKDKRNSLLALIEDIRNAQLMDTRARSPHVSAQEILRDLSVSLGYEDSMEFV